MVRSVEQSRLLSVRSGLDAAIVAVKAASDVLVGHSLVDPTMQTVVRWTAEAALRLLQTLQSVCSVTAQAVDRSDRVAATYPGDDDDALGGR